MASIPYIDAVIENMSPEQLASLEKSPSGFASRIKNHVVGLLNDFIRKQFDNRLATGRILCRPSYSFPASISPIDSTAIYDKSLYEAEESANKFETELIQAITGLPNIRWGIAISREQVSPSMALSTTIRILS